MRWLQPTGRALMWMALISACGVAGQTAPIAAAQVVEVRVGSHEKYTRIVFELDAPAGYRIERRPQAEREGAAILVTVNASTKSRNIPTKSNLLSSVIIEERLGRAVAEVRLKQSGLRLKEMILANPPRIVLDVMARETASRAPEPKRSVRAAVPKPPAPPKPAPVPVAPPVSPGRLAPSTAAAPAAKATESAMVVLVEEETPVQEKKSVEPPPRPARVVARTPVRPAPATTSRNSQPPAPVAPPATRSSRTSWLIGLGVLAVVIFVWRSMKRGQPDERELEPQAESLFSEEPYDGEASTSPAEGGEAFPPSLAESEPMETPSADVLELRAQDELPHDVTVDTAFASAGEPNVSESAPAAGDLADRIADLERRLGAMHSKLDANADESERVERQLAAQGEELRVQRAAIARTQRALRGLTRTEEEHPTEPALREPLG